MDVERLAATFVDLADTLVDDFDVYGLLHTLTTRCVELLGVGAAGVLLADRDSRLRVMSVSDHSPELAELVQMQAEQGPCLECYRAGGPVIVTGTDSVGSGSPAVPSAVAREGFTGLAALPLRLRGQAIGVLLVFETAEGQDIDEPTLKLAGALADAATIAILTIRRVEADHVLVEQLQSALDSRVPIEQAKGVLSNMLGVDVGEAFALLRDRARDTRRPLVEVAHEVAGGDVSEFRAASIQCGPPTRA